MRNLLAFGVLMLGVSTLHVPPAWSQSVDTGILGTVRDASGGVIPGSDITITSSATGVVQSVASGPDGTFEVRYLLPGQYVVQAALSGFRTERSTIELRLGQLARLNFVLQVGEVGEVVDVVAQGLLLETQSGVTANVVTADTIANLPLAGRNFTNLGNLSAGVVASATQFRASGARGMYQQVSFNGVSVTNNRGNNLFMYPSVDAVEEFKVQSTNYTAEYGGHAGANVQLQFKSGSNQMRGAAFNYFRDDALDERNYFAPAPRPKPQLERNQFGGVLSGPIRRRRTFFMGSYEGLRETRENAAQAVVLTPAMRRGDFSEVSTVIRDPLTNQPFPGNIIPTARLHPLSVFLMENYMPLPNQAGANNLGGLSRNELNFDQFITRIDHVVSDKHKIFGHYFYNNRLTPSVPLNSHFWSESKFRNQNMAVQWVSTFSDRVMNEIRVGYMRGALASFGARTNTDFDPADLGITGLLVGGPFVGRRLNQRETGFPQINIQGFSGFNDGGSGYDLSQTYQFVDNFTWIRGQHALKMGMDVRRLMGDAATTNWPRGRLDFTRDISGHAAAAFMLGYPRVTLSPEGAPHSGVRQFRYGFYFQDDWRATPKLTLNLGLRYDHNLVPKELNGISRTLRFDLDPSGPVLWPEPGEVVYPLYFNKHLRWSPRFGFAYQLNEKMVLRGGYGIFNMAAHLDQINTLQLNPPHASIQVTNPNVNPIATITEPFPRALIPAVPVYNITSAEADRNHKDGYYQNWNIAAGYQFTPTAVVEVRYVGSRGHNLDTSLLNFNSPDPDPTASALDLQSRRPYPQFGRIRIWATDGTSEYNSLQSEFKHRGPWGLSLSAAYTLAKLMDNQSGGLNASRSRRQNPRDITPEWAPSNDDMRQRFVLGYVWDIPFGADRTGVVGGFLSRWQFSGVLTLESGQPVFITQDGDILNTDPSGGSNNEIRPDLVPGQNPTLPRSERSIERWFNTAAFTRARVTYGNSPRNPVVGPGSKVLDVSLAKGFELRPGQQLQFRIEAFNAMNWVNWGDPNGTLGSSDFGVISSAEAARELQLSLKYVF